MIDSTWIRVVAVEMIRSNWILEIFCIKWNNILTRWKWKVKEETSKVPFLIKRKLQYIQRGKAVQGARWGDQDFSFRYELGVPLHQAEELVMQLDLRGWSWGRGPLWKYKWKRSGWQWDLSQQKRSLRTWAQLSYGRKSRTVGQGTVLPLRDWIGGCQKCSGAHSRGEPGRWHPGS